MGLKENFKKISDELESYPNASLIAVSKYSNARDIQNAFEVGQIDFGENRVDDLASKALTLKDLDLSWHFIGNLQSGKINKLLKIKNLKTIHSIDRHSILDALLKKNCESKIGLYLQVNTSGEEEKSGFEDYSDILLAANKVLDSKDFYLCGLMTMGKVRSSNQLEDARVCFNKLKDLKEKLENAINKKLKLSMGMSSDYKVALDCGADVLRLGSILFK